MRAWFKHTKLHNVAFHVPSRQDLGTFQNAVKSILQFFGFCYQLEDCESYSTEIWKKGEWKKCCLFSRNFLWSFSSITWFKNCDL